MKRTLVVVLTHRAAHPILTRNWSWIVKSGCRVVVVDHVKDVKFSPESIQIGTDPDNTPNRWVDRFIATLEWCLSDAGWIYKDFCIVESDVIFTKRLPKHPGGLVATKVGGASEGFIGSTYWHCPWWIDRRTAEAFLGWAKKMIAVGLKEHGFVDRFIGLMADLYPLKLENANWYSENTIHPERYDIARNKLAEGAWGCHGVKTEECLKYLTSGIS